MVNSNKYFNNDPGELYCERGFLALFLMSKDEFDLYGWKYIAEEVPCWKGIAPKDKSQTLKNYKFTLCYENTWNQPGYMTERIFDCFLARSIPIYLGAPDILDYVPEECFVNIKGLCSDKRGSSTYQHIYNHLKSIDENKYSAYIQAGQDYLDKNPKFKLFSNQSICNQIMIQLKDCNGS